MKKKIFLLIRAIISFGIIFYIFNIIPYEQVFLSIRNAKGINIIIALFLLQVVNFLAACKYKILTDKQKMTLTTWEIIRINYFTKFYDLFLPQVLSGGVIRWYILSKNDKKPAQALASMLYNRYTDMQVLSALGFLFWVLDKPPNTNDIVGISLAILTIILFSTHFFIFSKKFSWTVFKLINKIPYLPEYLINKFRKLLVSMGEYQTLSKHSVINIYGFILAKHLIGILTYFFFALSLGLNIRFEAFGWIRTIILLICSLPISIGGIGVREGSLMFLLGTYGVASASAVAFSFLLYFGSIVGSFIGGALIVINLIFFDRKKKEQKI